MFGRSGYASQSLYRRLKASKAPLPFAAARCLLASWLLLLCSTLAATSAHAEALISVFPFPGSTAVGSTSATLAVPVSISQNGTATTPIVVTQGKTDLDFQLVSGSTCQSGGSYTAGQQCTVNVAFAPKYPGRRSGAVILENTSGTVLGLTLLTGTGTGSLSVLSPGNINTVAGNVAWIYNGDGQLATASSIFLPMGVVTDAAGNIFISDSNNDRIRRVDAGTGIISTVAGDGSPGYSGDGGLATAAEIASPAGIVIDGAGDLYFADTGNQAIRRVDAVTGIITTVAGTLGVQGYSGDHAAATTATLSLPEGLAFDAAQNLYIADTGNNVIRLVSAATGTITTFAGTGVAGYSGDGGSATAAELDSPWSVGIGTTDGLVYIADLTNNAIRKVSSGGIIATIVGNGQAGFSGDTGLASSAQLDEPASIVFDPAGNMYIADSGNNRVREVYASSAEIETIAGTNGESFAGDSGPANNASLYGPYALYLDQAGDLLVADMFHNRVRSISANAVTLPYPTMRVDKVSAAQNQLLSNNGNAGLTIAAPTLNQSTLASATTTCNTGDVIASGLGCELGVEFAPTSVGDPVTGTLNVNSNAANTPSVITLTGEVLSVNPTTVSLISSLNPAVYGSYVTFTATVSSAASTLSGTMAFLDGTSPLCGAATVNSQGVASCTTPALSVGEHTFTASYSGDEEDAASVSPAITQIIQQVPTVVLAVTPNPSTVTSSITLKVTATGQAVTPTGAVTFYDGTTVLSSAALNTSGVVTISTSSLTPGTHNLLAKYAGDTLDVPVTSNTVNDVVNTATTTTTMSSSSATIAVGASITLSSTVTSNNGPIPTGTVVFSAGKTVLGTGALNSAGSTSVLLPSLGVGSYNIIATYSGNSDNSGSASSPLIETVQQIVTTTTAATSSNPASAGATINLTAEVALGSGATADGALTGTVTFTDGTATIGTATLNTAGQATLAVSALSAGTHSIVATYNGSTDYAISKSVAFIQQIENTPTTTTISIPSTSVLAGEAVTFTIGVGSPTGIPTGSVTIYDGSSSIAQAVLSSKGIATFTTSSLSLGTQTLKAVYGGDPNYLASTSSSLQVTVSLGTTALTLAGPSSAVDAGVTLTVTAALTSNGVAPTGTLTLRDSGAVIATQNASGAGSFSFSTSSLPIGSHTLTAVYAGNSDDSTAVSSAITVVVQQGPTSTAFTTSANPSILGKSLTLSASVTSVSPSVTGSIAFEDGGKVLGSVSLVNGAATFTIASLGFGAHTLTAVYSGDTNHGISTSAGIAEQIVEPATATLASTANPSISGSSVTFTAKIAGVGATIPTGSVIFSDGSTTLGTEMLDATGAAAFQTTSLAVGSHTISVSYTGDRNYSAASANLIQTVQIANTQVTLTASANPTTYHTVLDLAASISSNGSAAMGTVTFTDGGVSIGSAVLNGSGVATLATSTLSPGEHTFIANYAGDGTAGASVSTPLVVTVKQLTSTAVVTSSNPSTTLSAITFTATVTNSGVGAPTGAVTFTDAGNDIGTATLNGSGQASLTVPSLSAGNHSIAASYGGDATDFNSVSANLNQSVQLRSTTTSLAASQTNASDDMQVTLIAIVRWSGATTPTGTVTFSDASGTLGTSTVDSTGVATLTIDLQASTETITATYGGDSAYAGSSSAGTSVTGGAATQFTLALAPPSATVQTKQHIVVTLTATSIKSFSDTLQLGCLGLPYAATCTFSNPQIALAANGASTVQLTVDTANPLGEGAQANNRGLSSSGVMLCMLPGTLLTGLIFFRKRRCPWIPMLLLICAVAVTFGATGCGGLQGSSTPAGSYSFRVTASGVGSGFTETQVMNLTVTQ